MHPLEEYGAETYISFSLQTGGRKEDWQLRVEGTEDEMWEVVGHGVLPAGAQVCLVRSGRVPVDMQHMPGSYRGSQLNV